MAAARWRQRRWRDRRHHRHRQLSRRPAQLPCSLTPDSRDQAVDLGDVSARDFRNAGDRSAPVRFRLSFRNCLLGARALADNPAGLRNGDAGRLYLQESRPRRWCFGESDVDNPSLLKLNGGVQGIGLRLQDQQGGRWN